MSQSPRLPVARPSVEFVIETLADEVLVYDQTNHTAHCLTPAASLVWKLCDGGSADKARVALSAAGFADSIEVVVQQLLAAGLVRDSSRRVNESRRRLLGKTAVAAGIVLASPVVYSILAPSVAQAGSKCGGTSQDCCAVPPNPKQCVNFGSICLPNQKCS